MKKNYFIISLIITILSGCSSKKDINPAIDSINAESMKKYISTLASDDFQGRAPATVGEEKTINYLAEQFKELGLEPAVNGSYFQQVALLKITADKKMKLDIAGTGKKLSLDYSRDFIGSTPNPSEEMKIENSEIVFAGYGIVAPEYGWNDYSGLDVKGKTVIVLVNDPGYATGDTSLFTGKAMTYYGRWTYKYEEAARQGAAAVLIIHETGPAGYPWEVVNNSWSGPQFSLENNSLMASGLQLKGWLTGDAAEKIFKAAQVDLAQLKADAAKKGFKPLSLNLSLSTDFRNSVEHVKSNNVAALLPGKDRPDEYIIYTAHWDHFGINPSFTGDSILNGALDNATGVAALLELAKAFRNLPEKQDRSVLFLSVTCEEQGLLGSEFYARNPLFPLDKTAAVINMDALNILGPTKDMTIVGYGNSGLDKYAEDVLKKYGRYAQPDPTPEKGSYFRSDHFSFAREGVPALYLSKGVDDIEHGRDWALKQSEEWTMQNYHKPSDNYEPEKWNFNGMMDDIKIYFEIGYNLSMTDEFPNWSPSFPFKAKRDEMRISKVR
ncbi:MAG: M28 family metallopeptidase [Methanosarcina sp.]